MRGINAFSAGGAVTTVDWPPSSPPSGADGREGGAGAVAAGFSAVVQQMVAALDRDGAVPKNAPFIL